MGIMTARRRQLSQLKNPSTPREKKTEPVKQEELPKEPSEPKKYIPKRKRGNHGFN